MRDHVRAFTAIPGKSVVSGIPACCLLFRACLSAKREVRRWAVAVSRDFRLPSHLPFIIRRVLCTVSADTRSHLYLRSPREGASPRGKAKLRATRRTNRRRGEIVAPRLAWSSCTMVPLFRVRIVATK